MENLVLTSNEYSDIYMKIYLSKINIYITTDKINKEINLETKEINIFTDTE